MFRTGTGYFAEKWPGAVNGLSAQDQTAPRLAFGAGAQLCIIRAFALAEASVLASYACCGIVCATLWGMVLHGAFPDFWTLAGALVIVGSGLYVWSQDRKAAPVDPDTR